MKLHVLRREQLLAAPREEVFPFFAAARNLEAITPPWLGFEVLTPDVEMRAGTRIEYRLRLHGVRVRWLTWIAVWDPPHRFVDVQLRGPYRVWHHTHEFESTPHGTRMTDTVRYGLPLGAAGEIAHALFVGRDLERIFDFRRDQVTRYFIK